VPDLQWLSDGPVIDLGEQVLLPGLINAHCHLDYSMMRLAISEPKSFTAWVQRINVAQSAASTARLPRGRPARFWRVAKVGHDHRLQYRGLPELMTRLPPSPLRTCGFYEMIDIRHRITTTTWWPGALSFFSTAATPSTASV